MTNKKAIRLLNEIYIKVDFTDEYGDPIDTSLYEEAIDFAIKALGTIDRLKDMRDNAYRLYCVEDGKSDYSYGRKQVIGTVHSDLEELLDDFER